MSAKSLFFPRHIVVLWLAYTGASLLHFVHNAEYIALYPGMPTWLTREQVYGAWWGVASVGVVGVALACSGWRLLGTLCLVAYGALGLDGLAHYALALCSQHTWTMNATIWTEVAAGVALALGSARMVGTQLAQRHMKMGARSSA